jgi:hypothetical protein
MKSNQLEIKRRIMDYMGTRLDQCNEKGLKEYGSTLEDQNDPKYDWRDMMIEELFDACQYAHKRALDAEKKLAEVLVDYDRNMRKMANRGGERL